MDFIKFNKIYTCNPNITHNILITYLSETVIANINKFQFEVYPTYSDFAACLIFLFSTGFLTNTILDIYHYTLTRKVQQNTKQSITSIHNIQNSVCLKSLKLKEQIIINIPCLKT